MFEFYPAPLFLRGSLQPLSIVAFFSDRFGRLLQNDGFQRAAHNPENREKPNRPTDQVPDPDSGQVVPVREPTRNCTTKFVVGPLFHVIGTRSLHIGAQGMVMSTLAKQAISDS